VRCGAMWIELYATSAGLISIVVCDRHLCWRPQSQMKLSLLMPALRQTSCQLGSGWLVDRPILRSHPALILRAAPARR